MKLMKLLNTFTPDTVSVLSKPLMISVSPGCNGLYLNPKVLKFKSCATSVLFVAKIIQNTQRDY